MGTDSAPHPESGKLSACGCAGIYTAPVAMGCLAQIFEQENSLDQLESFVSRNGARFYGLPEHQATITLIRHDEPLAPMPAIQVDGENVTVFDPMQPVYWSVAPDGEVIA
jgi:dihydroorotase